MSKETFEDSEPWSGPEQAIELAERYKKATIENWKAWEGEHYK